MNDANPGSLEKALDAFQAYIEKVKPDLMS